MFPRSSAIFVLDIPQGLQDLSWVWVQDGQQGAAGDVRNPWEWGVPREFQEDICYGGVFFFPNALWHLVISEVQCVQIWKEKSSPH